MRVQLSPLSTPSTKVLAYRNLWRVVCSPLFPSFLSLVLCLFISYFGNRRCFHSNRATDEHELRICGWCRRRRGKDNGNDRPHLYRTRPSLSASYATVLGPTSSFCSQAFKYLFKKGEEEKRWKITLTIIDLSKIPA